jgi:hypothetical protein
VDLAVAAGFGECRLSAELVVNSSGKEGFK